MIWTLLLTMAWGQSTVSVEDVLDAGVERIDTGLWLDDEAFDLDAVVGGTPVGPNDWDDTVGIVMRGNYVGCTGTLIHPKVVLTAAHCMGGITAVAIGSKNWAQDIPELIEVAEVYEYPNSQSSLDVAVLVLERRSSFPPRAIGIECTVDDFLVDGAEVAVVGFGATRQSGNGSTTVLHEGVTYVQDADGDENYVDVNGDRIYTGFNPSVSPGGEVGAGGNGVDACFGDSGGPLYLKTDDGHVLVGVTSRAYAGVPGDLPCAFGGIYARPDALIDWIAGQR
jgi:secreted trypsin-like serine protease